MTPSDNHTNSLAPEGPDSSTSRDGMLTQDVSRRKFLRTAVIGTAGVAGAAGVAGIVLSQHGSSPTLQSLGIYGTFSTNSIDPVLEPTEQNAVVGTIGGTSGYNYNNAFWFAAVLRDLPASTTPGTTYTVQVLQSVNGGTYTAIGGGTSTAPFVFGNGNGNGNFVQVYGITAGTAGSSPYSFKTGGTFASGTSLASQNTLPVTFTLTAPNNSVTGYDVGVFVHMKWGASNPTTDETVTLQVSVYSGSTATGTPLASNTVTINADA